MALYWPEQHVALEIVDDPHARPFDRASDPDATVIQATVAEISDLESVRALAKQLAVALGENLPEDTQNRLRAGISQSSMEQARQTVSEYRQQIYEEQTRAVEDAAAIHGDASAESAGSSGDAAPSDDTAAADPAADAVDPVDAEGGES